MFKLNERLDNDTIEICDLSLCKVLLMNDSNYPWLILVPQINGLTELHQIPENRQGDLWKDIANASEILENLFSPKSLNVAALGNVVSQLHIHVVARFEDDPTWPGPIWGQAPAVPYSDDEREILIRQAFQQLQSTS